MMLIASGFSSNGYSETNQELYETGKSAYVKDDHIKAIKYLFAFIQLQGEGAELAVLNEVKLALDFSEKQLKEAQAVQLAVERGEYDETTINQTAMFSCHCPESGKTTQPNFKKLSPKLVYIPKNHVKPNLKQAKFLRLNTANERKRIINNAEKSDGYRRLTKKVRVLIKENKQLKDSVERLQKENIVLKRRARM